MCILPDLESNRKKPYPHDTVVRCLPGIRKYRMVTVVYLSSRIFVQPTEV